MSEPVITRKNAGFGDYYEVTLDGVFICEIGRLVTGTRIHSRWYYRLASMKRESQKKYPTAKAAWDAASLKLAPKQQG